MFKLTLCEVILIIGKQEIGGSQMNMLSLFLLSCELHLGTFSLNIISRDSIWLNNQIRLLCNSQHNNAVPCITSLLVCYVLILPALGWHLKN